MVSRAAAWGRLCTLRPAPAAARLQRPAHSPQGPTPLAAPHAPPAACITLVESDPSGTRVAAEKWVELGSGGGRKWAQRVDDVRRRGARRCLSRSRSIPPSPAMTSAPPTLPHPHLPGTLPPHKRERKARLATTTLKHTQNPREQQRRGRRGSALRTGLHRDGSVGTSCKWTEYAARRPGRALHTGTHLAAVGRRCSRHPGWSDKGVQQGCGTHALDQG